MHKNIINKRLEIVVVKSSLDSKNLTAIVVSVEELYSLVKEMKDAGEKVVHLQICEPVPDIELGKHISFEAYGTACGGATDYEQIETVTQEEYEQALWYDTDEEDIIEGYVKVKENNILNE